MTTAKPVSTKKWSFKQAMFDLLMLLLMLSAAGFGGYFYGTHQRMIPVEMVPPGTPGAKPAGFLAPTTTTTVAAKPPTAAPAPTTAATTETPAASDPTPAPAAKKPGKTKYWLSSTGSDLVGYSISVTVNDQPVDNFFAPGKQVDITRMVKKGENSVEFEAKELEDKFNQHKGDQHYALTVNVVGGPYLQENYKPADVLVSYRRNAAESQDYNDTMHFVAD